MKLPAALGFMSEKAQENWLRELLVVPATPTASPEQATAKRRPKGSAQARQPRPVVAR